MTENEIAKLEKNLKKQLSKANFVEVFKLLDELPSAKGSTLNSLRNKFIGGHIDNLYTQQLETFVDACIKEEREDLEIKEKEQPLTKFTPEIWLKEAKDTSKETSKRLEAYAKAIELKPDYTEAYFERGKLKKSLKRYQEAMEDFTKALECNPNFTDAYYQLTETKQMM